jgi:Arc/MetJ-type ribon-helix-helix transcriptional regulator
MSTISIPITSELNQFIEDQVSLGKATSKAELIRRAIIRFKEEEFISSVLEAKKEIKEGKALTGDLDTLAKGFN